MIELIPIESFAPLAQIDVIDGSWLTGETWADADDIGEIISTLRYELHLMVANPIEHLEAWTELPSLKRVIFHVETATQPKQVIEAIRYHGWDVGVALNPETPTSLVRELGQYVDEVMLMTVKPGASGRPFEHGVLKKIAELSEYDPRLIIGVDGAISAETLALCFDAGVTRARVNSSLFGTGLSAANAWAALQKVAQHL